MNPFSKNNWKKAAYRAANNNGAGNPAWFVVGLVIVLVVLYVLLQK